MGKDLLQEMVADLKLRWGDFAYRGKLVMPSGKWKVWAAMLTPTTCKVCKGKNGAIYASYETPELEIPVHQRCRCAIRPLLAILAGTATVDGENGAGWYLMMRGELPPNYLSKAAAKKAGWKRKNGNLASVLPGILIERGIFQNGNGKLPLDAARVWYEADIDYPKRIRSAERILYSSDGLIFVTYDHYDTFFEIVEAEGMSWS